MDKLGVIIMYYPSPCWYTVNWIPYWFQSFETIHNNLHAKMHLKCRLLADSPSWPQRVIGMSSELRVYVCDY